MPNQPKFCTKRFVKYWDAVLDETRQALNPQLINAYWVPLQPGTTAQHYNLDVTFKASIANMDSIGNFAVWRVLGLPIFSTTLAPGGIGTHTITGTLFNVQTVSIICNITAPLGKARIYDATVLAFLH